MRNRILALLFATALMPLATFAQSYSAILTGGAEVPGPGDPDGTGIAVVRITGTTLTYTVWAQNIGTPTGAHIHSGAAGVAGDVVVGLDVNMLSNGTVTISEAVANQINANPSGFYVNVHTSEFPGGAVRGQLTGVATTPGVRSAFIPVVGKVQGANRTNFVTDLRVINTGAVTANVTLDFFPQSPAGHASPAVSKLVTVAPGEQKVLNDVVGTTLGLSSGLGGLRITSDQSIVASARIINDLRAEGAGTAGFALPAQSEGRTSATIMFLSNDVDFRTNIGYFNPSASSVTATLSARRSSDGAVLGTTTITIPAYAMVQQPVFSLLSSVSEADRIQTDFYVTWSSTAPLFVYGAVTDNKTGDAVVNQ